MLSQFDKNTPILLQHFQRPIRTSLMASLQTSILFLLIFRLLVLIQRNAITASTISLYPQKPQISKDKKDTTKTREYSLINTHRQRTSHPPTPLHSTIRMLHIISKSQSRSTYTSKRSSSQNSPFPSRSAAVSICIPTPTSTPWIMPLPRIYPELTPNPRALRLRQTTPTRPSSQSIIPTSRIRSAPRDARCDVKAFHLLFRRLVRRRRNPIQCNAIQNSYINLVS